MQLTADFLEAPNDLDVACALGLCAGRDCDTADPKVFKCKVGDNHVHIHSIRGDGLKEARETCQVRSDLHIEPVGGAGHIIMDPTPDHDQASDLFTRNLRRINQRVGYKTALRVLFAVLIFQIVLLLVNHAI